MSPCLPPFGPQFLHGPHSIWVEISACSWSLVLKLSTVYPDLVFSTEHRAMDSSLISSLFIWMNFNQEDLLQVQWKWLRHSRVFPEESPHLQEATLSISIGGSVCVCVCVNLFSGAGITPASLAQLCCPSGTVSSFDADLSLFLYFLVCFSKGIKYVPYSNKSSEGHFQCAFNTWWTSFSSRNSEHYLLFPWAQFSPQE